MYIFIFLVALAKRSSKRKIQFFFRCQGSERLEFTVPDGVAKGSSPGKGGPLATDRFLRPFLPEKRVFF